MRLQLIYEQKSHFDYQTVAEDMWREILSKAKKEFNISFDAENDSDIAQKTLKINQNFWKHVTPTFNCELRCAGGDWQDPIYYFRCQLVDGYALDMDKYHNQYIIYIPGINDGNPHLVETEDGWSAPDNEDNNGEIKPNESKCWKSLNKYLQKLVNDGIKSFKHEEH